MQQRLVNSVSFSRPRTPASQGHSKSRVPPSVYDALEAAGSPLPASVLSRANAHFQFDFSQVRIHDDAQAGRSALTLNTSAYAVHPHIVFAPGRYRPETPRGQALLFHELGHIRQQSPRVPGAPLHVGASPGHEQNADSLAHGHTRVAQPLSGNIIARDERSPAASEESSAEPAEPKPIGRPVRWQTGEIVQEYENGTVRVYFPPRSAQLIVNDQSDKADRLQLPTGEHVTQREAKRLIAVDTPVVAFFEKKNIGFDKDGNPEKVLTHKPIQLSYATTFGGKVIQSETGLAIISPRADAEQRAPSQIISTTKNTKREGVGKIKKAPATIGGNFFPKLEISEFEGDTRENSQNVNYFLKSRNISTINESQRIQGRTIAQRGLAESKDASARGLYLSSKETNALIRQSSNKDQFINLGSGKLIHIYGQEQKNSDQTATRTDASAANQSANTKAINNYGTELVPVNQETITKKDAKESNQKLTKYDIYVQIKDKDGTVRLAKVGRGNNFLNYQRSLGGAGTSKVSETRASLPTANTMLKTEEPSASYKKGDISISGNTEHGAGIKALNLSLNSAKGYNRPIGKVSLGTEASKEQLKAPIGKADIATAELIKKTDIINDEKRGNNITIDAVRANVTSNSADVQAGASASVGRHAIKPSTEHYDYLGIIAIDEVRTGLDQDFLGGHAEAQLKAQAELGEKGVRLRAGSIGASVNLNAQLGYVRERQREFRVRPKIDKLRNDVARAVIQALDPVIELKAKYQILVGAEGSVNLAAQRGADRASPYSAGASAFAGARATGSIEGSVQLGRAPGVQTDPRDPSKPLGAKLASLSGSLAGLLGLSLGWKTETSVVGTQIVVGGSGSLGAGFGLQGSLRAEIDVYKLGTALLTLGRLLGPDARKALGTAYDVAAASAAGAAHAVGTAASATYHHDDNARALINSGEFRKLSVPARTMLVQTLLRGLVSKPDQRAILAVLEHAASQSELGLVLGQVSALRLYVALDGGEFQRYRQLLVSRENSSASTQLTQKHFMRTE